MTPGARYAAAIVVLDRIFDGEPAERALTNWARNSRFAGSKDRAAIRDIVFDILRRQRSACAWGGGTTGRNAVLGLLRMQGTDPAVIFTGDGYAPAALSDFEKAGIHPEMSEAEACDLPDWLWPVWQKDLGAAALDVAEILRDRGPITLRVNTRRSERDEVAILLQADGIETKPHPTVKTALHVIENERRISSSSAFLNGLVEFQDASSQAAVAAINVPAGAKVLDYCAGGGGKSLAFADLHDCTVTAYDIDPKRMADIPARAARAGVSIELAAKEDLDTFDVVFVDAPCSGSGTWRRTPAAKWALDSTKLSHYNKLQGEVLDSSLSLLTPGGTLVYATCSVIRQENHYIMDAFLKSHLHLRMVAERQILPDGWQDGFYFAVLNGA